MNPRVAIALLLVGVFAIGAAAWAAAGLGDDEPAQRAEPLRFEGATLPEGLRAPGFALRDEEGKPLRMSALRGKPVVVTFLYTSCRDSCPAQAQTVKGALNDLGEDVPAVAIAVDPPRDDPENARRFLAKQAMSGRMRFALGTRSELAPLWRAYAVQPQSVMNEHTGRFVLVDPKGFQRVAFPLDKATPGAIAHDLRLLRDGV